MGDVTAVERRDRAVYITIEVDQVSSDNGVPDFGSNLIDKETQIIAWVDQLPKPPKVGNLIDAEVAVRSDAGSGLFGLVGDLRVVL
jgi:hypothetical protein